MQKTKTEMKKDSESSTHEKPEILIAEDSLTQAEQLKHLLESHDYKVTVANNGKEAIDKLSKHKPALVISDIMMPEMNGYELCKEIKSNKNTGTIPVILLTSLSDPEEIIKGLSCGADSFISKPYNEEYLISQIEKNLSEGPGAYEEKVPFSTQILFKGKKRYVQAEQQKVIKLLVNIYEGAVQQNEKLIQSRDEFRLLNNRLESIVEDRTSDLSEEIKLSNQIIERLMESEEKWRTLVTTIPDYIGLIDCEGKFLFLNHYAEGFSEKETIGKNHIDFIPDNWKEFYQQKFEECINTQKNQIFEYSALGDNKKSRTYETCLVPIVQQGKVLNVMAIASDITERKRTENALKESEEKFRSILENSADAIFITDTQGKYIYTNKEVTRMLGFTSEEMKSKTILDLAPKNQADKYLKFFREVLNEGKVFAEIELLKKDSNFISTDLNAVLLPGGTIYGSCRDITERKRSEDAILRDQRLLRTLIDNIPDLIYVKDIACRKVISNIADIRNIGYETEEEVQGKTDLELFSEDIGRRGYADDKEVINSGVPIFDHEENFVDKWGIIHWFVTSKIPLFDKDGKITGLVGIGHDITRRKSVNEELIKAKEKAEESDRLKSAFLANMSHEIRTPMNGILGFTELLKEPNLSTDDQQDFIQTIQSSGERMLNTINNIVNVSKIESGLMNVVIDETNINKKIEITYKFFKPEVEKKGLQFVFKNGLPTDDAVIRTDNEKVYGILTNLIKNAIKFTNEGSIEFGYEKKGDYLEFYVKDTGIGIPRNKLELIFERFRQGSESHNRGYEGSGLGLAIAKSYIEMLGGEIWVESEAGQGSVFHFTIPYIPVSDQTNSNVDPTFTEDKEIQIRKLKILIVEDDEISYSLLSRVVQKISKEVLHAMTGVEAIEACRKNPDFDLVLMDIRMPKMNGLEATQQIRQFNRNVIIIAQTAYGFSDDYELALNAGCNDYISKPINKTLLFELIKKHVIKY
jgi:hypothetical protein